MEALNNFSTLTLWSAGEGRVLPRYPQYMPPFTGFRSTRQSKDPNYILLNSLSYMQQYGSSRNTHYPIDGSGSLLPLA